MVRRQVDGLRVSTDGQSTQLTVRLPSLELQLQESDVPQKLIGGNCVASASRGELTASRQAFQGRAHGRPEKVSHRVLEVPVSLGQELDIMRRATWCGFGMSPRLRQIGHRTRPPEPRHERVAIGARRVDGQSPTGCLLGRVSPAHIEEADAQILPTHRVPLAELDRLEQVADR